MEAREWRTSPRRAGSCSGSTCTPTTLATLRHNSQMLVALPYPMLKTSPAILSARAEDHRPLAPQRSSDEQWYDRAVLCRQILAGTEDVEVAQHDGFEAVGAPER